MQLRAAAVSSIPTQPNNATANLQPIPLTYSNIYDKGLVAEVSYFLFGEGFAVGGGEQWRARRRAVGPSLHKCVRGSRAGAAGRACVCCGAGGKQGIKRGGETAGFWMPLHTHITHAHTHLALHTQLHTRTTHAGSTWRRC
jgi:hypothetical protein